MLSRTFSSSEIQTLCHLKTPHPPPPTPGDHHSTLELYKHDYSESLIYMYACDAFLSVSSLLHLV